MLASAALARKQAWTRSYHCHFADAEGFYQIPVCGAGVLAARRRGVERSAAGRASGIAAAVGRPRQPGDRRFTGNFRVELDQRAETPVNVVQIVVGPTGFVGASEQAVVDYIRSSFVDRPKPDLIVTIGGPAAVFARKYRQQLFPDTPTPVRVRGSAVSR